jgi:hypothetical protein
MNFGDEPVEYAMMPQTHTRIVPGSGPAGTTAVVAT